MHNTSDLSTKENEIVQAICCGKTNKEIVEDLNISINTLKLIFSIYIRSSIFIQKQSWF
jgi:DNA-binding NarL/FixJ family response regulator